MTKQEYAAYEKAVSDFLAENRFDGLAPADPDAEPFFSWASCDCCGSSWGGTRETYKGFRAGEHAEITDSPDFNICSDCVFYLAYGQLDDLTMMEMDD